MPADVPTSRFYRSYLLSPSAVWEPPIYNTCCLAGPKISFAVAIECSIVFDCQSQVKVSYTRIGIRIGTLDLVADGIHLRVIVCIYYVCISIRNVAICAVYIIAYETTAATNGACKNIAWRRPSRPPCAPSRRTGRYTATEKQRLSY